MLSKIIGMIIFTIALIIANMLQYSISNDLFHSFVGFFNQNFGLVILMSVIFLIAEMFFCLVIPFNLIAPPISAVGSLLTVTFLMRLLQMLNGLFWADSATVAVVLALCEILLYPVVFMAVLISGYVQIFVPDQRAETRQKWKQEENEMKKEKTKNEKISWREVGEEFKLMLFDAFHSARTGLKAVKKSKARRTKRRR